MEQLMVNLTHCGQRVKNEYQNLGCGGGWVVRHRKEEVNTRSDLNTIYTFVINAVLSTKTFYLF